MEMAIAGMIALLFKCYTDSYPSLYFLFPKGKANGSWVAKDRNKRGKLVCSLSLATFIPILVLDQWW